MVICNFYVVRSAIHPAETDPPLIVDANRLLAASITSQLLQAVARRREQVAQIFRFVEVNQLSPGGPLNCRREMSGLLSFENVSGFIAGKTLDHRRTLSCCVTIDKRHPTTCQ